jgi:type IV secretory pathway VirB2 component (pilin)
MRAILNFFNTHKFALMTICGIGLATYFGSEIATPIAEANVLWDPARDTPSALSNQNSDTDLRTLILRAINFVLGFVGLLAVIMLIWGGIQYITSQGGEVDKANKTILYAIIGIIIILFSFAIINTVFDITSGSDSSV